MARLGYGYLVYDLTRPLVGRQQPQIELLLGHLEAGRGFDEPLSRWLVSALRRNRRLPYHFRAVKRGGRPKAHYSIDWLEPESDEDKTILNSLMKSLANGQAPCLLLLIEHIEARLSVSRPLARWVLAALKRNPRMPFHLVPHKRMGRQDEPDTLERRIELYERVKLLSRIRVTTSFCDELAKRYPLWERGEGLVRGRPAIIFNRYYWDQELRLVLGRRMTYDNAIHLVSCENRAHFQTIKKTFYEMRRVIEQELKHE